MSYTLEFELQGLPNLANKVYRGNWRGRHGASTAWKTKVFRAVDGKAPPEPLDKAKVTCTRCSSAEPDYDGLVISFKPFLDALKLSGVIVDDKRSVIGVPEYLWEKANPKAGKVKIKVEAITTTKETACNL